MKKIISRIRNKMESSSSGMQILDVITQNGLYQKYIHHLFLKKTAEVKANKRYSFAIEVTSFCNANCTFCPNSRMKRHKNIMSMELINKLIERIKDEGITPTQFNLTGTGEPLIDKDIFEKIRLLKKNFPTSEIFFPTNLGLATPEIQKKLVESSLDNVSVSLNANNAEDYKNIMRLDYATTIKNLNGLIAMRNKTKSKLKIYIKLAANPVNKESIDAFIKKWEKKVDGVGVSWIHSWAGEVDNGDKKVKPKVRYPCKSLFEQIIIHSNGNIPLCCVDYEGKVVGGNIMTDKILTAFNAPNIEKIRSLHSSGNINQIKMCSQCRFSERGLYWLLD